MAGLATRTRALQAVWRKKCCNGRIEGHNARAVSKVYPFPLGLGGRGRLDGCRVG